MAKERKDILLFVAKAVDKPQKPKAINGILIIAKECENINIPFFLAISARLPPTGCMAIVIVASADPNNKQIPDAFLNCFSIFTYLKDKDWGVLS
jgi:hypothetical protein